MHAAIPGIIALRVLGKRFHIGLLERQRLPRYQVRGPKYSAAFQVTRNFHEAGTTEGHCVHQPQCVGTSDLLALGSLAAVAALVPRP